METIRWVVTPPCRSCGAPPEFARRYSCFGCEKIHREKIRCDKLHLQNIDLGKAQSVSQKRLLSKAQRQDRNARVVAMRDAGLSYGRIALVLNMPRPTVQGAETAGRREVSICRSSIHG